MWVYAMRSHMQYASHKSGTHGCREQLSISTFCAAATITPLQTSAVIQTNVSTTSSADLWVTVGATPTLCTKVLWFLDTAVKHNSFISYKGIGEVFKAMFPNSDIAKSFTFGKDKIGYIIRFGLVKFFNPSIIVIEI